MTQFYRKESVPNSYKSLDMIHFLILIKPN